MATVPLSGTDIRLLSSIPFSNDYKHTRWFDTVTDQTAYFGSKPVIHSIVEANFQRIDGHSFLAVNKSVDDLWNVNYVMFRNTAYNNKWFYGFVTKLEYKQRNNTHVHFQIDVFQTWKFEMNFKPSYMIREHCKLWNEDGSPVVNTIDEGLNYGNEYDTTSVINYQPTQGWKWLVILSKTPIHNEATNEHSPVVIGTPQPLTTYMIPFKDDDTIPPVIIPKTSQNIIISKPTKILTQLYKNEASVNNIVSLYITDYTGIPVTIANDVITFPDNGNEIEGVQMGVAPDAVNFLQIKKVIEFDALSNTQNEIYTGFHTVKESKLLMSPYTQIIFDDFKGNRVTFKPEYINHEGLEIVTKGSVGTSNYTSYGLKGYNMDGLDMREEMSDEHALINTTPNDIPIITDMLSAYLQGNRNSIQNQRNSAVFNGTMGILSSAGGAIGSTLTGQAGGLVAGVGGIVQGAGNSVLQLQGINAKIKDIDNTPPSISKMGSNTSYTIGNKYNGLFIIKKHIKPEYIKKLEDFFNMFGYKVNEVKTPNFHTRQYWNYVQTSSCNITGNFNHDDLNELKMVFDGGITLWHTDDIGNYSLGNEVL
jgi:hypothetical protein